MKKERVFPSGRNMAEIARSCARLYGDRPAFGSRGRGKSNYHLVSFAQLDETATALATALADLGIQRGEHVAILADNRLEWIMADLAVQYCGAVDVPRGSDITVQETEYILQHGDVVAAFIENREVLARVEQVRSALPQLRHIIVMDPDETTGGGIPFYDLVEQGRELRRSGDRVVEGRIAAVKPDDLFTLIYTSGTTGKPKGVMLTHGNLMSQLQHLPLHIDPADRALSILPVWHIFERTFELATLYCGATTYYSSVRTLRDDLARVRPTLLASAPRLWESVYDGIQARVASGSAVARALFRAAAWTARLTGRARRLLTGQAGEGEGSRLPRVLEWAAQALVLTLLWPWHRILDLLVLRKLRAATGGCLRYSVSGGGALPAHIDNFFNDIGIPVLEGYGLTETSPMISARRPGAMIPGTVGRLLAQTEVRIVSLDNGRVMFETGRDPGAGQVWRGELHVRGPQVMRGYYKDDAGTRAVLDADGWFNTGDIVRMSARLCLSIIGRSKETIVLSSGENVEPVPIENRILESRLIDAAMVIGQDRKSLGALLVPAPAAFDGRSLADLAADPDVHRRLKAEIRKIVSGQNGFKSFERIGPVVVLPEEFRVGAELTAKLSLKRHAITQKYARRIEDAYGTARTQAAS